MYDGSSVRRVFNMDACYDNHADCAALATEHGVPYKADPYALYEGMQEALRKAGLYFEEATGWYAAVYST